jgi:hypothetical protein
MIERIGWFLMETKMSERLRERLNARLEALRINPFEAERRAAMKRGYINDLLIGKKATMRGAMLAKVAEALECDPDYLIGAQPAPRLGGAPDGVGTPIFGIIEPGVWREADAPDIPTKPLPMAPDPRFPADRQRWFLTRGDTWQSLAIADGSVVIAVSGVPVRDGDPVVVRRTQPNGATETCLRVMDGGDYRAVPGTRVHPEVIPGGEAEVLGLVVMAFRTFAS